MKITPNLLFVVLLNFILLLSCTEDDFNDDLDAENNSMNTERVIRKSRQADQQVVVMAAPSVDNSYYRAVFQDIVDFQINYANQVEGRDAAIILVNRRTRPFYEGKVPDYVLVDGNMEDIWIRDFGSTIANRQVKFKFSPDYMNHQDSRVIDRAYKKWMRRNDLPFGASSHLILDGGNVVDNGNGRVIVTDRFLYDNPQLTKNQAKRKLMQLMKARQVAIINESPGDATGHADGMVMWVSDNKILLHQQDASVHNKIVRELRTSFPGVEVVVLDDHFVYDEWQGFVSACNIFVNSLVTHNYIYVPTFNMGVDNEMLATIQKHTDKTVVEIPAEKVCFMGGSVRCLTWNVDGQMADWLLQE